MAGPDIPKMRSSLVQRVRHFWNFIPDIEWKSRTVFLWWCQFFFYFLDDVNSLSYLNDAMKYSFLANKIFILIETNFIEMCFFTAVVMAEWTKLLTCLVLVFYEEGRNTQQFIKSLRKTIIENPVDTMKVCVPSLLYVIQNNLLYLSASNLDAATYQVCSLMQLIQTMLWVEQLA